jgi:hypothetical protein
MGMNVKEAVLVAASHKHPPTVTVSGAPLLTDLVKAKSADTGPTAGTELRTTLTVPLVAVTETTVTGSAVTVKAAALTTVPPL